MINNKFNILTIISILLVISTLLILIVPKHHTIKPNNFTNIDKIVKPENVKLNKYMNIQIDVDTDEMLELAYKPSELLNQNNQRQARPLLIYTAHIISKPIDFIFKSLKLDQKINVTLNQDSSSKQLKNFYKIPIFLSYVLINYFVLFLSMVLFIKICLYQKINFKVILLFLPFLTLNINTKYFLLNPHFQIFNILCPLVGCYIFQLVEEKKLIKSFNIFLINLLFGFLILFYSIFFVLTPIFILALMFNKKKINQLFQKIIFSITGFSLPSIFWILYLKNFGREIYFHEAKTGMFTWILDLSFNDFIPITINKLVDFFYTFNIQIFILLALLFLIFKKKDNFIEYIKKITAFLSVFIVLFGFLYLVGFYQERLSVNLIFPLILILLPLIEYERKKFEFFMVYIFLFSINLFYLVEL